MTNILILDNDECLGYFGLINGIYNGCIHTLCENKMNYGNFVNKFNDLFTSFSVELLIAGYARKGLKSFFENIKKLKYDGIIHQVVMMTSDYRFMKYIYKCNFDWIRALRNIFEKYANIDTKYPNQCIYNLDYSYNSDEVLSISTKITSKKKNVSKIIDILTITHNKYISKIVCIDKEIKNIDFQGKSNTIKVIPISISSFYALIPKTKFYTIISKYSHLFASINITQFIQICILNYNHDNINLNIEANSIYNNDNDLDIDLHNIFKN